MRRRSSSADIESEETRTEPSTGFLQSDVKRSIVAVLLFAFSMLFVLGFLGIAGPLGSVLDRGVALLLGWGKWVFPFVLLMAGFLLLHKEKEVWSSRLQLIGLFVAFLGLLGFFHLFFDLGEMIGAAKKGVGGGFVGAALAYAALKVAGDIGGVILLFTFFLIGVIAAFNVSLVHWLETTRMWAKDRRQAGINDALELDEMNEEFLDESREQLEETEPEDGLSAWEDDQETQRESSEVETVRNDSNITNLRFADGEEEESSVAEESEGEETSGEAISERPVTKRHRPKKIHWELPPFDLADSYANTGVASANSDENARIIQRTLKHFDIDVEIGEVRVGPTVTQYTFRPAVGVKLSKITALSNDLAYALAATSIRIEAPIPGKSLVGIEVPNGSQTRVGLRNMLEDKSVRSRKSEPLLAVLGKGVSGEPVTTNLDKLPHVLIAGATNSGKSVCINAILLSLLYHNTPEDLQLILVDPKRVELTPYNKIPHLKTDVIVEPKKVVSVLRWAVGEMENRYRVFERCTSRDINSYREKQRAGGTCTYTHPETHKVITEPMENFPYIIIVIDEMADLMMAHGKDVEALIVRLAQMSRAVGIHLVLATQRPSIEVITGLIKANITARIAFQVATQIDSRTILDMGGAEKLLGRGDMLYLAPTSPQPRRVQGVFVSEEEVRRVTDFWRHQARDHEADIPETFGDDNTASDGGHHQSGPSTHSIGQLDLDAFNPSEEDERYAEAKQLVLDTGKASTSFLQRRLSVGYSRAAKLLDLMEQEGIIGPSEGTKARAVYVGPHAKESGDIGYDDAPEDDAVREKWEV